MTSLANALRILSAEMVEKAKSGHPGMPLGMADVFSVLWTEFLVFDAQTPDWFNRDRFVLSGGHGSALLYSMLYLMGFEDITQADLATFRQKGSKLAGHPEYGNLKGIEVSTGPLGQGLGNAVGMAIAERLLNARFGDKLVNHKIYVTVGDGDLMEGISEEAIALAGHLKLGHLIALWDDNKITIDGSTDLATSTDIARRFTANGWQVLTCDGHNPQEIRDALATAQNATTPVLIDCKTIIGWGAPNKQGTSKVHGSPLGQAELDLLKQNLNWPEATPFTVPADILKYGKEMGARGHNAYLKWQQAKESSPNANALNDFIKTPLPPDLTDQLNAFKQELLTQKEPLATRKAGQIVLEKLADLLPFLIQGSADLAGSCFTKTSQAKPITATDFSGNYIAYGVREHVMGAIMNGLALNGFLPVGSTFFSFMDYMKPAVRMSALMHLPVIFVWTHDSIGVGEDGPTHQPIEQLASLRAMPDFYTFRPADLIETAESYQTALTLQTPCGLVLARQATPQFRTDVTENKTAKGAYVLFEPDKQRDFTLIATGTEVSLAMQTKQLLAEHGYAVAVVSMPCWELFQKQPQSYQDQVLGKAPRIAIEAGSSFGWEKWVGDTGLICGIDEFGFSAPAGEIYEYFNLTAAKLTDKIKTLKGKNA